MNCVETPVCYTSILSVTPQNHGALLFVAAIKDPRELHQSINTMEVFTLPRVMTCQEPSASSAVVAKLTSKESMTVKTCQRFCLHQHGTTYAALSKGDTCYCMNVHGTNFLERDSECNLPCTGDRSANCGGTNRWLFYKIGKKMHLSHITYVM